MPQTIPDDLAVRKVRESEDKTFVLRVLAAAKERLSEFEKQDAEKEAASRGRYRPIGVDVVANPGTNFS
jgi:hypothetical protein